MSCIKNNVVYYKKQHQMILKNNKNIAYINSLNQYFNNFDNCNSEVLKLYTI